jgi:sulfate adenylyltransferase
MSLVAPHGGSLVNRLVSADAAEKIKAQAKGLTQVTLSLREQGDWELLANGGFSPLKGFMGEADFKRVCSEMRLANGTVWPIPVILSPADDVAAKINVGDTIALNDSNGQLLGTLKVTEKYAHDKTLENKVYGTDDAKHPGIAVTAKQGSFNIAGDIDAVTLNNTPEFAEYRLTPTQTRKAFADKGWNTVAAFQTRNPIHRSHEYLTKCALEMTDGLLIHPVVGETKADDIPAQTRMDCYTTLIKNYYTDRTMLSVLPLAMRYAGPREAVLHTIIRKNYGISHFIVGRDHAGVGTYYGTYDAQKIFEQFKPEEIGVTILKFEHTAWCKKCEAIVSSKTCPHGPEDKIAPSGTKVRDLLKAGERPPEEFSRPEIADILIKWAQSVG